MAGAYWNHQPQTEVELLRRGFHIAFVAPGPNAPNQLPDPVRQRKTWDVWYKFLTENHGLAKKPAFVGMSRGGTFELDWGVFNPDKVACIYSDNTALFDEDFAKLPELAKHDVPLLHVVGSEDYVLQYTMTIEKIYHQLGGSITVIMKEGVSHHPHSLADPTPIADWIEQHMQPSEANRPAFADATHTKTHYYSLDSSYIYLKQENTYAPVRGPGYVPSYDRYTFPSPVTVTSARITCPSWRRRIRRGASRGCSMRARSSATRRWIWRYWPRVTISCCRRSPGQEPCKSSGTRFISGWSTTDFRRRW